VPDVVKGAQPPRRSAKVVETRRRILDAAQELFLARGYGATTIDAIAEAAGVSVPTVYVRFESKRQLLQALLDRTIAGDDEPVPMLERDWMRDALSQPDPSQLLRRVVHHARLVHERTVALVIAVRAAAGTDSDLQGLWDLLREQRFVVAEAIGRALRTLGAPPEGLTRSQVTDVLYAELSPDAYQMLVIERGWTPRAWEQWTTRLLTSQLVAPTRVSR
jgi:AcrR family transcriptional regulator